MTIDLIENKTCKTEITLIDLLDKICNHRNNIYFHINDFCDEPFEEIDFLVEKQKIEWNKIKNKPIKNFYISSIDVDDEIKVLLKINLKE